MKIKQKIYTVVLTWNNEKTIYNCIKSIRESSIPNEIVIVDNNSIDNTLKILKSNFHQLTIIGIGSNLGCAAGNNIGINFAIENKANYIFLLNPDAIVSKTCIEKLLLRMEQNKQLAITSPKIYYFNEPNRIWFAGSMIDWKKGTTYHIGQNELDIGQHNQIKKIDRACGCAMLVRSTCILDTGLMDTRYFLYFEETDWSVKFTKNNYDIEYVPDAVCWHDISSSTGGEYSPIYQYYMTRNRLLFMYKNGYLFSFKFLFNIVIQSVLSIFRILVYSKKPKLKSIFAIFRGYHDFYTDFYKSN